MSIEKKIISSLKDVIRQEEKKTKPYVSSAKVTRIDEEGTVWVHLPGGVDETPTTMLVNAAEGDMVNVRVAGGKAYLTGNQTAPPTDDTTATRADKRAKTAQSAAVKAESKANTAKDTADTAQSTADSASTAAATAQGAADAAQTGVDTLNTFIRSYGEGVEVARKDANGNYVGYKSVQTPTGLEVRTADDVLVAKYADEITIGQEYVGKTRTVIENDSMRTLRMTYASASDHSATVRDDPILDAGKVNGITRLMANYAAQESSSYTPGNYSAALGYGTKATAKGQTVVGANNVADDSKRFIVGGGEIEESHELYYCIARDDGREHTAQDGNLVLWLDCREGRTSHAFSGGTIRITPCNQEEQAFDIPEFAEDVNDFVYVGEIAGGYTYGIDFTAWNNGMFVFGDTDIEERYAGGEFAKYLFESTMGGTMTGEEVDDQEQFYFGVCFTEGTKSNAMAVDKAGNLTVAGNVTAGLVNNTQAGAVTITPNANIKIFSSTWHYGVATVAFDEPFDALPALNVTSQGGINIVYVSDISTTKFNITVCRPTTSAVNVHWMAMKRTQ